MEDGEWKLDDGARFILVRVMAVPGRLGGVTKKM